MTNLVAKSTSFVQVQNLKLIENIVPGFNARFCHANNVTIAFWDIAKGGILPEHAHANEQITILLSGEFALTINGETESVAPGGIGLIPPHAVHSGRALTDCRILDVFQPVREDYLLKYETQKEAVP